MSSTLSQRYCLPTSTTRPSRSMNVPSIILIRSPGPKWLGRKCFIITANLSMPCYSGWILLIEFPKQIVKLGMAFPQRARAVEEALGGDGEEFTFIDGPVGIEKGRLSPVGFLTKAV